MQGAMQTRGGIGCAREKKPMAWMVGLLSLGCNAGPGCCWAWQLALGCCKMDLTLGRELGLVWGQIWANKIGLEPKLGPN